MINQLNNKNIQIQSKPRQSEIMPQITNEANENQKRAEQSILQS